MTAHRRPCPRCGEMRTVHGRHRSRPRWFDLVRRGDTLLAPCGQRRVLAVWRGRDGALRGVQFQKLRRSQYDNPRTTYTASDLLTIGYGYLGHRRDGRRGLRGGGGHG